MNTLTRWFDKVTDKTVGIIVIFFTWPIMWIFIYKMMFDKFKDRREGVSGFSDLYSKVDTWGKILFQTAVTQLEMLVGLLIIEYFGLFWIGLNFMLMSLTTYILTTVLYSYVRTHRIKLDK
jgi:uncharacterized membrane protein